MLDGGDISVIGYASVKLQGTLLLICDYMLGTLLEVVMFCESIVDTMLSPPSCAHSILFPIIPEFTVTFSWEV